MLGYYLKSIGIEMKKNKKKNGKTPQRRTSITEERKRNTNHWNDSDCHSNIYKKVEKENRENAITKNSRKG